MARKTRQNYEAAFRRFIPTFGDRDPATIGWREIQTWIADETRGDEDASRPPLAPGTLHQYISKIRKLFDYADVDPNPARDRRLEKPALVYAEAQPPTRREFHAVLERVPEKTALLLRLLEATALRPGEGCSILWGDVDTADSRIRVSARRTKGRTGGQRWVQVPRPVMDELELLCPVEDRTRDRRVFPAVVNVHRVEIHVAKACALAGVAAFTPHDLRHRRLSLWHAQGVPGRVIQDRAGHSDLSTTHDTYTHVVIDARDDDWLEA